MESYPAHATLGGNPAAASVRWELVRNGVGFGIGAAYQHLLTVGAQGQLLHNDDTSMVVLELSDLLKHKLPIHEEKPERTGVYTSNILSLADDRPPISLYC